MANTRRQIGFLLLLRAYAFPREKVGRAAAEVINGHSIIDSRSINRFHKHPFEALHLGNGLTYQPESNCILIARVLRIIWQMDAGSF